MGMIKSIPASDLFYNKIVKQQIREIFILANNEFPLYLVRC